MENEIRLNEKQSERFFRWLEFEQVNEEVSPWRKIDKIRDKYRKVVPSKTGGLRIDVQDIPPEEERLIEQLQLEGEKYNEYLEKYMSGETDEINFVL